MLPTTMQQYVHMSRYARWNPKEKRRETWAETVERYASFFHDKYPHLFPTRQVIDGILNTEFMPSMRCMMTAGAALERDNMAGYNCAYRAVNDIYAFDEILHTLMCGTGVGFSVERKYIQLLPTIPAELKVHPQHIKVQDSKEGWATALRSVVEGVFKGWIFKLDVSQVRPKGARLLTFGGRASGPEPLVRTVEFITETCRKARGRKLTSLECHDICCVIASNVVVGGVRRSALLSLSDIDDKDMQTAKSGEWWKDHPHRALANISTVYQSEPGEDEFWQEWGVLEASGSGERGIYNRFGAKAKVKSLKTRNSEYAFGTNPCGEIILRHKGLCNLTEAVIRAEDTLLDLVRKVQMAAILGTFQSTLTNFGHVSREWKLNAEDERLLGVSLTGIMDHPILSKPSRETRQWLQTLRNVARETNNRYAQLLGIRPSAAITTVKPSGTVSQLVDSASGIHPRYSKYYIRTIRADKKDPLALFLREKGVPVEDCVNAPNDVDVFAFPVKAPTNCVVRDNVSAIEQLKHYVMFNQAWCDHSPSITVYVRSHEWRDVGRWVHENFKKVGGVTFLPYSDHVYQQAPYQECDELTYHRAKRLMPELDWSEFYEAEDNTVSVKELACSAGVCEL